MIMKYYYIYIAECSDGSYYTGVTNDLQRRFDEHNGGLHPESYTYKRRPVKFVHHEEFTDVWEAISREKQIKHWSKKKKKALVEDKQEDLMFYSKRKRKQKWRELKTKAPR